MREASPLSFFGTSASQDSSFLRWTTRRALIAPGVAGGRREAQLRERHAHLQRPARRVDASPPTPRPRPRCRPRSCRRRARRRAARRPRSPGTRRPSVVVVRVEEEREAVRLGDHVAPRELADDRARARGRAGGRRRRARGRRRGAAARSARSPARPAFGSRWRNAAGDGRLAATRPRRAGRPAAISPCRAERAQHAGPTGCAPAAAGATSRARARASAPQPQPSRASRRAPRPRTSGSAPACGRTRRGSRPRRAASGPCAKFERVGLVGRVRLEERRVRLAPAGDRRVVALAAGDLRVEHADERGGEVLAAGRRRMSTLSRVGSQSRSRQTSQPSMRAAASASAARAGGERAQATPTCVSCLSAGLWV